MAIGDDAAAAGMDIVPGTTEAKTIDTEINKTRDYIAQRTSSVQPIAKGGTGATTAALARTALGVAPTSHQHRITDILTADGSGSYSTALQAVLDTMQTSIDAKASAASVTSVAQGNMTSDVYNRTLGGSYRVTYVNSSGVLGWVSSSRRFKKNIQPAVVDIDAILAMQVVTFIYKVAIDPAGNVEHGLIAEQLDELGLTWLVDYGEEGVPDGVRYERLALALLPVVQNLNDRLTALEQQNGNAP